MTETRDAAAKGKEALAAMRAECTGRDAASEVRMAGETARAIAAYVAMLEQRLSENATAFCAYRSLLDNETALAKSAMAALADAEGGLRYIQDRYGELDGVGFDRVFDATAAVFASVGTTSAGYISQAALPIPTKDTP